MGNYIEKGFTTPWFKGVDEAKGKEPLSEAHAGQAGVHEGVRALAGKPTTYQDAVELTRRGEECQAYSLVQASSPTPCLAYLALGLSINGGQTSWDHF
uniref:Uncharacterized protein n=1 Tax=Lactuca sativa TaxID=4236 RepID=A0A9R1WK46_LACSA|nr:hypothetical protein LSAT_V11C100041230 [Lactuca sativa]